MSQAEQERSQEQTEASEVGSEAEEVQLFGAVFYVTVTIPADFVGDWRPSSSGRPVSLGGLYVGVFIVSISRGRTIREVILRVILATPSQGSSYRKDPTGYYLRVGELRESPG